MGRQSKGPMPKDPVALGFDLSTTSTGWAIYKRGRAYDWGVIAPPGRHTTDRLPAMRAGLQAVIINTLEAWGPIVIVGVEAPFLRGPGSRGLIQVRGHLDELCRSLLNLDPLEIAPTAIKKWATGSGAATKTQMVSAAQMHTQGAGPAPDEHDQADAILVAAWAWDQYTRGTETKETRNR